MSDQLRGFRVSSAQRGGGWPSPVVVGAVAVFVVAILLIVFHGGEEKPDEPPPIAQATVIPSPSPAPTARTTVEESSEWVTVEGPRPSPTYTQTPWGLPLASPPRAPRIPTPTPPASECVSFRWSSIQAFSPSAQVKVEINAVNRCGRDIDPLDLWFEVTGWRNGELIQTARGHPFDPLRRRHSVMTYIGLPGSIDWYDEIRVEIVD